jgi:hypothetical protein
MKVGDLVIRKEEPKGNEQRDVGIVIGFKPRNGVASHRDPTCDVWNDAIIVWASAGGPYFHMRALVEVISESG